MSAPVFLLDGPDIAGLGVGETVLLDGDEGRHAVTVRRMTVGEPIELVDGFGRRLSGVVAQLIGKSGLLVTIQTAQQEPPPVPQVIVVQAIPKGERGELAVETLTEVGVDVIVPWAASRCVAQWRGDKVERGVEKWRRSARESTKQARRAFLPVIRPLASTQDICDLLRSCTRGVVLHEEGALRLASLSLPTSGDVVLVVGPEGGISEDELAAFAAAGALPCRLGSSVLRTSTAGTAAVAVVLAASGRWS